MRRDDRMSGVDGGPGGVHTGDVRAEGLSIFDGHPKGGFEMRILGYDRAQVEEHIRQLEQALAYTRAMNRQLDRQIAQLRQQLAERSRLHLARPAPPGDGPATPPNGDAAPSKDDDTAPAGADATPPDGDTGSPNSDAAPSNGDAPSES